MHTHLLTLRSVSDFLSGPAFGEACVPVAVRKAHQKGREAPHSTEVKGPGTTGALALRSPVDEFQAYHSILSLPQPGRHTHAGGGRTQQCPGLCL